MRVLFLDPGERVGWCSAEVYVPNKGGVGPQTVGQEPGSGQAAMRVTGHGIAYLKDMALSVHQAVAVEKRYDLVGFEKWALTAKGARVSIGSEMESSQFVGMIRQSCWLGGVKIVKQPTSALSSADRSLRCGHPSAPAVAELIAAADSVSHDDGHDGSALRHLWTFFFERYV